MKRLDGRAWFCLDFWGFDTMDVVDVKQLTAETQCLISAVPQVVAKPTSNDLAGPWEKQEATAIELAAPRFGGVVGSGR
jgi:hypothetical protein